MTDPEIVIALAQKVMGWQLWPQISATSYGKPWNPLESQADALELEGNIPDHARAAYLRNLCYATDAFMGNRGAGELHARDWKLRRATPRQIATAVWETCCRDDRPPAVESDVARLRKALEIAKSLNKSGEVLITELRREVEELKVELKPIEVVIDTGALGDIPYCPCGVRVIWNSGHRFKFCSRCGKRLLWKD